MSLRNNLRIMGTERDSDAFTQHIHDISSRRFYGRDLSGLSVKTPYFGLEATMKVSIFRCVLLTLLFALGFSNEIEGRQLSDDSVYTDKTCYAKGEDIEVSFTNSYPQTDDWVGIYPFDADPHYLDHPKMWLWTCGDQYCRGKRSSGTLTFGEDDPVETGTRAWPLPPGKYIAVLARNDNNTPYEAYAVSEVFTVRAPYESCDAEPVPTPYPTPEPTPYPTKNPTPKATPAPTQAPASVSTDKMCYHKGEDIKVSFTNPHPYVDDWVGIYYDDAHPDSLGHPLLWLYTCGTQHCSGKRTSGELVFGSDEPDESGTRTFPLPAGNYIAIIARNAANAPYEAYATSMVFEVKADGESCFPTPSPTKNPTKAPTPNPTKNPTKAPTPYPTKAPTPDPTKAPTPDPTKAPTPDPTKAPTPYPTKAPTPMPVADESTIETDKLCYTVGEDIEVTFFNSYPEPDDWVGIYYSGADTTSLEHPLLWLWTCGDQSCRGKVRNGMLVFGSGDPHETGTQSFPLYPGEYIAVLARNGGRPYSAYAVSMTFAIKGTYEVCPGDDSITTDKLTYEVDEEIIVSFENSSPMKDDWVGIYDANADPHSLGEPLLWVWTCGDQQCSASVSMGSVTLGPQSPNESGKIYWPLPKGTYIAVLARNGAHPYQAYAVSDVFEVVKKSY